MGSAATMTELGSTFHPATLTGFLGGIPDGDSKVLKMEEYVRSLEEERRKIEAFKRELPLCMLILTDVISALKEEVTQRRRGVEHRPVLEQFMPLKNREEEHDEIEGEDLLEGGVVDGDKMNWMSSAQLWSDNSSDCNTESNSNAGTKRLLDETVSGADQQSESGNPFGGGGAFVPFKVATPPLLVPDSPILSKTNQPMKAKLLVSPFVGAAQPNNAVDQQQQQGGARKVRRCWSPELHRRFVAALQQLGGPQAATPKQIRDLMKVDGLTNDEVKSHLQKYRLHTRRPTPSNSSTKQTALLGGLWMQPKDRHYATSKPSDSQSASGSPKGPLQFAVAGGGAHGVSLTGVDSCDEEDMKSESFSWKGSQRLEEEIDG